MDHFYTRQHKEIHFLKSTSKFLRKTFLGAFTLSFGVLSLQQTSLGREKEVCFLEEQFSPGVTPNSFNSYLEVVRQEKVDPVSPQQLTAKNKDCLWKLYEFSAFSATDPVSTLALLLKVGIEAFKDEWACVTEVLEENRQALALGIINRFSLEYEVSRLVLVLISYKLKMEILLVDLSYRRLRKLIQQIQIYLDS